MAYEMTIKERLRKFVHFRDLKDYEFETTIKVARGFLSSDSEPNGKAIVSILTAFPDINPDWLILGAGEMTRTEKTPSTPNLTTAGKIQSPASSGNKTKPAALTGGRLQTTRKKTKPNKVLM